MNIIILGGGTAGWLTALFVKKILPFANITLIQSKSIGIIGVGEATTPNIPGFLVELGIDPLQVVSYTNGSIKNGISFENWNGDGQKYFHGFKDRILEFGIPNLFDSNCEDWYLKNLIKNNLDFNEYLYQANISYQNKVDLDRTSWAIHFDANKFAEFLEIRGVERGIRCLEDNYSSATLDDNGFIKELTLTSGKSIALDFLFDCSGFSREIIGKVYKSPWKSYSKFLPMKKAIPFWLDSDDTIQPYTSAIAMKYGWIWKIPLQHRIGSGYIFDSDYIDTNQALAEAETFYGQTLEIRKVIDFEAGRFENFWIKNCMAVGLSSSFIEPLESTSLFLSVLQLQMLKHFIGDMFSPNEHSIKKFNMMVNENMDETLAFVYLHYITKRTDSEFWQNFNTSTIQPEKIISLFEDIQKGSCKFFDFTTLFGPPVFGLHSYLQVCKGLNLINTNIDLFGYKNIKPSPISYRNLVNEHASRSMDHRSFLNMQNRL